MRQLFLCKIHDWILKSENEFCVSFLNRLIQDLSDHGASKEPKNCNSTLRNASERKKEGKERTHEGKNERRTKERRRDGRYETSFTSMMSLASALANSLSTLVDSSL